MINGKHSVDYNTKVHLDPAAVNIICYEANPSSETQMFKPTLITFSLIL